MPDIEPFTMFRWALGTVCTIYAGVVTWQSVWPWITWFGSSRQTAVLGKYTLVLLIRTRIRRHRWELLQITGLSILFLWIVYQHQRL